MRSLQSSVAAWVLVLPVLVRANLVGPTLDLLVEEKKSETAALPTSTLSYVSPVTTTDTFTIDTTSALLSSEASTSQLAASTASAKVSAIGSFSSISLSFSSPTPTISTTSDTSSAHRTLVIVLSTVLGFLGLVLTAALLVFCICYRNGGRPFNHRGASPINDDEIATWRGATASDTKSEIIASPNTIIENTRSPPHYHSSSMSSSQSPGWTWSMGSSPTSTRVVGLTSAGPIPDTPSFLARAPNSRAGLTDEAIPGADPFVATVKRQTSRLSKTPPGHSRSKSRRSSNSGRSISSYLGGRSSMSKERVLTWYDPEDEAALRVLRNSQTTSTSPVSPSLDIGLGGLSPRPPSPPRPETFDELEIGRAIA